MKIFWERKLKDVTMVKFVVNFYTSVFCYLKERKKFRSDTWCLFTKVGSLKSEELSDPRAMSKE